MLEIIFTCLVILALGVFAWWCFRLRTSSPVETERTPQGTRTVKIKPKDDRYGYQQFGLLAAMLALFLAYALFVNITSWAIIAFWVLWGVGLLVAIVATFMPGFAVSLGALLLGAVLVGFGSLPSGGVTTVNQSTAADTNVGGNEARAAAPAGSGTQPETCKPQFVQDWDPNQEFRLASNGLWDNAETREVTVEGAVERQKALAGHDARYLAASAWSVGLWDDANNVAPLLVEDKTCLSTEGVTLYDELVAKWDSATAEIGEAPADGLNTGSNDGTFVINASNGISGDRTALVRTYPDGSTSYDLIRCGNPVLPPKDHDVPRGPTDETPPEGGGETPPPSTPPTTPPPTIPPTTPPPTTPPPTTPPPTTPPTTPPPTTPPPEEECPPEDESPECNPKDPADDVPGPEDKPTAPAPTGEPESEPPVEENPADPSDQPGDAIPEEEDVTAPGATEEPDAEPTPDPIDQGNTPDDPEDVVIPDPDGNNNASEEGSTDTSTTESTDEQTQESQTPALSPTGAAEDEPPVNNAALGALALPFLFGGLGVRRKRERTGK